MLLLMDSIWKEALQSSITLSTQESEDFSCNVRLVFLLKDLFITSTLRADLQSLVVSFAISRVHSSTFSFIVSIKYGCLLRLIAISHMCSDGVYVGGLERIDQYTTRCSSNVNAVSQILPKVCATTLQ